MNAAIQLVRQPLKYQPPVEPASGDLSVKTVCLVTDALLDQQERLYVVLSVWERMRYAGGWLVPVNCLKRFCADYNEVREAISAVG